MSKQVKLLCLTLLMVFTGANACRPQVQEERLRYETIERENHGEGGVLFEERQPEFFVVAETSDVEALDNFVSAHSLETLRNLDFDDQFAIVVFQGWQPDFSSSPFGVEVQSLDRRDSSIIIGAHIYGHVEGRERYPEVASPYHAIEVWREEDMHGDFEFTLKVDGEEMGKRIRYLPWILQIHGKRRNEQAGVCAMRGDINPVARFRRHRAVRAFSFMRPQRSMKGKRLQNGAPWFGRVPKSAVFVLLVALLANLVACKPKEIGIPFETLVQGEPQLFDDQDRNFVVHYESADLMVATDPAEAQNIADRLSPERPGMRLKEIADVDYGEYLVIAAYFGAQPHGGFVITIEKITQAGHDVNVVVSTVEPTGGDTTVIHPIHAVRIKRVDLPVKGHLVFRLWKEGEVVLTREHSVP